MEEFRELLKTVDRYYDGFEQAVISYIKMPGCAYKKDLIADFITDHPKANSSDVLEYMMNETGFWETYADYIPKSSTGNAAVMQEKQVKTSATSSRNCS